MEQKNLTKYGLPSEDEAEKGLMSALLVDQNAYTTLIDKGITSEMFASPRVRVLYDIISSFHATNGRAPIIPEIQRYLRLHPTDTLVEADISEAVQKYNPYTDVRIFAQYVKEAYSRRELWKSLERGFNMVQDPTSNTLSVLEYIKRRVDECNSRLSPPPNNQAEIDEWTYDTSEDVEEPNYLVAINNENSIPERSITAITGKAKAGKSNYTMLLMSALISKHQENICGIRSLNNLRHKILYIDTEQPKYAIRKKFRRMLTTAGLDVKTPLKSVGIHLLAMRSADIDKRLDIMRKTIATDQPDIVVIDGIVDMCHDFNDVLQASSLITELMQMTEQGMTVIALLHENEGSSKMRGHLGTFLLQKCDDKFNVSTENGQFKVKHLGRESRIPDLVFRIEGGRYSSSITTDDDKKDAIISFFQEQQKEILSQQDIAKYIMSKFNTSQATAYRWLENFSKGDNPILLHNKKTKVFKLLFPL